MNGKPCVIVTGDDLAAEAMTMLSDFNVVFTGPRPVDSDVVALCQRYDPFGIIVHYAGVSAAAIEVSPSLRVIAKHGTGLDTIDAAAAVRHGIQVCAATGQNANAVAEHTVALLLHCVKSIARLDHRVKTGRWDKETHKSVELSGRTLGLVGLGQIGGRVARVADAMGMKVIGHDPSSTSVPSCVSRVEIDAVWREANVISLHCPLDEITKTLLNRNSLASCKRGVIIINTARGHLIDEVALSDALDEGQVAFAAIDCLSSEPPGLKHPLLKRDDVVITPHVAGLTQESYVGMGTSAAMSILNVYRSG